jgi:hypothetical protein
MRVHVDANADYQNRLKGTYAFAVEKDIYFRKSIYDPDDPFVQFVLAHEVAHYLQKRLGTNVDGPSEPNEWQIEREANLSGLAFVQNKAPPALSPDPSPIPRHFGPVGHYFTVYYLALAAGIEKGLARKLALYAQMPDEISELDAVDVWAWANKWFHNWDIDGSRRQWYRWIVGNYGGGDILNFMAWPLDFVAVIHRGLHALTGKNAKAEQTFRQERLEGANINKPHLFGLAIHAYGDSFAHQNLTGGDMYPPYIGHTEIFLQGEHYSKFPKGFDGQRGSPRSSKGAFALIASDYWRRLKLFGSWVDNINNVQDRYQKYGEGLFQVLQKRASGKSTNLADVRKKLTSFSSLQSEIQQQIAIETEIRNVLGGVNTFYKPLETPKGWTTATEIDGEKRPSLLDLLYHAGAWARYEPFYKTMGDTFAPRPTIAELANIKLNALERNIVLWISRGH